MTITNTKESYFSDESNCAVDWARVARDFDELAVSFSEAADIETPVDDFEFGMDFVAGHYTILKKRLIKHHTFDAQTEELMQLDHMTHTAKCYMATSYAAFIEEELGNAGLRDRIIASIHHIFDKKVTWGGTDSSGQAPDFSMDELKAAGIAALQFSGIKEKSIYAGLCEEEMGIDLAVLGMQTEYLLEKAT